MDVKGENDFTGPHGQLGKTGGFPREVTRKGGAKEADPKW